MLVTIRRALYSPCNLDSLTRLTIEAQLDLSYRYFVYIRASIKKLNLFKKKKTKCRQSNIVSPIFGWKIRIGIYFIGEQILKLADFHYEKTTN